MRTISICSEHREPVDGCSRCHVALEPPDLGKALCDLLKVKMHLLVDLIGAHPNSKQHDRLHASIERIDNALRVLEFYRHESP